MGWMDEQIDGRMNEFTNEKMDGWMNGWMDGWTSTCPSNSCTLFASSIALH